MTPVPPLDPGCPWSEWTPPNLKWCEENLCSWITTPANTWSNLAYVLVALVMWRHARGRDREHLHGFAPATLFLAIASFMYHASYTLAFQVADFLGMYLVLAIPFVINTRRILSLSPGRSRAVYCAVVTGLMAWLGLFVSQGWPYQAIVGILIGIILGQEALIRSRADRECQEAHGDHDHADHDHDHADHDRTCVGGGPFIRAVVLLAMASVCSLLDVSGTICDPANHFLQGHAIWHALSALAILHAFEYYAQFDFMGGTLRAVDCR